MSKRHCSKNVWGSEGRVRSFGTRVARGGGLCAYALPAAPCRPPRASQQLWLVLAEPSVGPSPFSFPWVSAVLILLTKKSAQDSSVKWYVNIAASDVGTLMHYSDSVVKFRALVCFKAVIGSCWTESRLRQSIKIKTIVGIRNDVIDRIGDGITYHRWVSTAHKDIKIDQ